MGNADTARAAIEEISGLRTRLDEAQRRRDTAIRKMRTDDGMSIPRIVEATGLGKSLVRWVLR